MLSSKYSNTARGLRVREHPALYDLLLEATRKAFQLSQTVEPHGELISLTTRNFVGRLTYSDFLLLPLAPCSNSHLDVRIWGNQASPRPRRQAARETRSASVAAEDRWVVWMRGPGIPLVDSLSQCGWSVENFSRFLTQSRVFHTAEVPPFINKVRVYSPLTNDFTITADETNAVNQLCQQIQRFLNT